MRAATGSNGACLPSLLRPRRILARGAMPRARDWRQRNRNARSMVRLMQRSPCVARPRAAPSMREWGRDDARRLEGAKAAISRCRRFAAGSAAPAPPLPSPPSTAAPVGAASRFSRAAGRRTSSPRLPPARSLPTRSRSRRACDRQPAGRPEDLRPGRTESKWPDGPNS